MQFVVLIWLRFNGDFTNGYEVMQRIKNIVIRDVACNFVKDNIIMKLEIIDYYEI